MLRRIWIVLAVLTCALSVVMLLVSLVLGAILFFAGFEDGCFGERIFSFLVGGMIVFVVMAIFISVSPLGRLSKIFRGNSD